MEWLCCLASTLHSHDSLISLAFYHPPLSPFYIFVFVFVCCSCNVLLLIGDCLASYSEWNHEHIFPRKLHYIYFIWRLRIFLWGFTSYSFIIFESETLFFYKWKTFFLLLFKNSELGINKKKLCTEFFLLNLTD